MCACVCVSYRHTSNINYGRNSNFLCVSINITQKQIIAETQNLVLHVNHMEMLLEALYVDRTINLCTGAQKIIRKHYGVRAQFPASTC